MENIPIGFQPCWISTIIFHVLMCRFLYQEAETFIARVNCSKKEKLLLLFIVSNRGRIQDAAVKDKASGVDTG